MASSGRYTFELNGRGAAPWTARDPDTAAARQSVLAVIEAYRKTLQQQPVLWENARVCVAA